MMWLTMVGGVMMSRYRGRRLLCIALVLVKSFKNVENFIRFYETLKRSFPNNPGLSLEILSNPNLSSIFLV